MAHASEATVAGRSHKSSGGPGPSKRPAKDCKVYVCRKVLRHPSTREPGWLSVQMRKNLRQSDVDDRVQGREANVVETPKLLPLNRTRRGSMFVRAMVFFVLVVLVLLLRLIQSSREHLPSMPQWHAWSFRRALRRLHLECARLIQQQAEDSEGLRSCMCCTLRQW